MFGNQAVCHHPQRMLGNNEIAYFLPVAIKWTFSGHDITVQTLLCFLKNIIAESKLVNPVSFITSAVDVSYWVHIAISTDQFLWLYAAMSAEKQDLIRFFIRFLHIASCLLPSRMKENWIFYPYLLERNDSSLILKVHRRLRDRFWENSLPFTWWGLILKYWEIVVLEIVGLFVCLFCDRFPTGTPNLCCLRRNA